MKKFVLAAAMALLASSVSALDVQGVQLEDTVKVAGVELKINGAGVRSAGAGKEVYVAGLYLPARSQSAEKTLASRQPKRVLLVLNRDLKISVLNAAFRDGIGLNVTGAEMERLGPSIAKLEQVMKNVPEARAGERLVLDILPDGSVVLNYKGQDLDTIPGPDIGPAMLKIWLGDVPVSDDLKNALLAGARYGAKALRRKSAFDEVFDNISP